MGLRDHALRQERERPGGDMASFFMAEGDLVIQRALRAGFQLESVLLDERRTKELHVPTGTPILAAGADVLTVVTGRPRLRDPIGCFVRKTLPAVSDILAEAKTALVVEGVNNPTNMGVIMRNAAALGVEAVLLDPTACDPLYRRAVRVSMGEVFAIPHTRLPAFPEGLDPVKQLGFSVHALTPGAHAVDIGTLRMEPDAKVALMLGAEGPGLTEHAIAAADMAVQIPMSGRVDSVNVATAGAIAFYALNQLRQARPGS